MGISILFFVFPFFGGARFMVGKVSSNQKVLTKAKNYTSLVHTNVD
jgi:hypothetical protein